MFSGMVFGSCGWNGPLIGSPRTTLLTVANIWMPLVLGPTPTDGVRPIPTTLRVKPPADPLMQCRAVSTRVGVSRVPVQLAVALVSRTTTLACGRLAPTSLVPPVSGRPTEPTFSAPATTGLRAQHAMVRHRISRNRMRPMRFLPYGPPPPSHSHREDATCLVRSRRTLWVPYRGPSRFIPGQPRYRGAGDQRARASAFTSASAFAPTVSALSPGR